MNDTQWKPLNNIDQHCFGCGPQNPNGLQMTFAASDTQLRSDIVIPGHLRGWSHLVHGGVITTILDEIMGWTGIYFLNRFLLTKDIKVRFRLPVFIEEPVSVFGYIGAHHSDNQVTLIAELRNAKGQLAAKAEGEFVLFSPEKFASMNLVPADHLKHMEGMFSAAQREHETCGSCA
ncbi:PaaI family thioesterase [Thalassolituus sp. LLYu03]|uniref:PaaI family thioesterase n=1 Tax=Thalassolituus sp. LLYu03 TaxID=3421656 RepID=UPI003D26C9D0